MFLFYIILKSKRIFFPFKTILGTISLVSRFSKHITILAYQHLESLKLVFTIATRAKETRVLCVGRAKVDLKSMWNSSFRHSSSFLFFLLLFFLFFLRSSFSRPFLQTQIKNNPQPKSKITPQIHNISARSINPNPKITISTPKQLSQLCTKAAQVCCFSLVLLLVFVVFWVCCLWWYCCLVLLFSIFQVCCLRKWVWRFECQRDRLDARFWVRVQRRGRG